VDMEVAGGSSRGAEGVGEDDGGVVSMASPSSMAMDADFEKHFNPTNPVHLTISKAVLHASMGNPAPGSVRCRESERKSVIDLILKCLKWGLCTS
jgi:hypothetical protein